MRRLPGLAFVLCALPAAAHGGRRYFPLHTFDARIDKLVTHWYSTQLAALHEPSLFELAAAAPAAVSYRFLWLRSFDHPVAVRLEVKPDGTSVLFVKIASGAGGYAPGKLMTTTRKTLSVAETRRALERIVGADFWILPTDVTVKGMTGTDGAEWVMEGVDHGRYHLSEQWSAPEDGSIRGLGLFFLFELAELPKDNVY